MEIFRGMMSNPSDKISNLPFEVNNFGYYKNRGDSSWRRFKRVWPGYWFGKSVS